MAIGSPTNVQTAVDTSSASVAIASYAAGSESGRTLIVHGMMAEDGASRTLSCTFGATSMTEEVTRQDTGEDFASVRYRHSIFRLRNVSGTETITLAASASADDIGVIAYYIDGAADDDVEVTATAEDPTDPSLVSIGPGISEGAFVAYGGTWEAVDGNLAGLTPSGLTEIADILVNGAFDSRSTAGHEEAGASGSESGGWSMGESAQAATLVGASFAAGGGGEPANPAVAAGHL